MPSAQAFSYDEFPYDDIAFYHTHPSNLAVVAALCGLTAPPVETCRVLDLGCGSGFNLLAMKHSLPNAHLVGIDFSKRQIERGREMIVDLGCKGIELHVGDIGTLDSSLGPFDYIIAHGVYSWVPPAVSEALLALCQRCLAPNGLAYISYNTFPGWHARSNLRDILLFSASPGLHPIERTKQARAALERLIAELPDPESPASKLLRAEAIGLREDSDAYLFHEFLEADNRPVLFEEFARRAGGHGLRYLAEARFQTGSVVQREPIHATLDAVSSDFIRREQYHDFLRNRSFRQSLLCHAEVQPTGSPMLPGILALHVHARIERMDSPTQFRLNGGGVIESSGPVLQAMLEVLSEIYPRTIAVHDLANRVSERIGEPDSVDKLIASRILNGYIDGLWQLLAFAPPYVAEIGEQPRACPLARYQAAREASVTNRQHRPVDLNETERALLVRLDGRTKRKDLAIEEVELDRMLRRFADEALLTPVLP